MTVRDWQFLFEANEPSVCSCSSGIDVSDSIELSFYISKFSRSTTYRVCYFSETLLSVYIRAVVFVKGVSWPTSETKDSAGTAIGSFSDYIIVVSFFFRDSATMLANLLGEGTSAKASDTKSSLFVVAEMLFFFRMLYGSFEKT